jgi:hypothetical protein
MFPKGQRLPYPGSSYVHEVAQTTEPPIWAVLCFGLSTFELTLSFT